MGKIKYQTRMIPCHDCGTSTPGYTWTDVRTGVISKKEFCDKCAGSHMLTTQALKNKEAALRWEEAFDKYGYQEGTADRGTDVVVEFLQQTGYMAETTEMGLGNTVVTKLVDKNGKVLIHGSTIEGDAFIVGQDNPREYLPKRLVEILDEEFK